jgi:hypothetical protein
MPESQYSHVFTPYYSSSQDGPPLLRVGFEFDIDAGPQSVLSCYCIILPRPDSTWIQLSRRVILLNIITKGLAKSDILQTKTYLSPRCFRTPVNYVRHLQDD